MIPEKGKNIYKKMETERARGEKQRQSHETQSIDSLNLFKSIIPWGVIPDTSSACDIVCQQVLY